MWMRTGRKLGTQLLLLVTTIERFSVKGHLCCCKNICTNNSDVGVHVSFIITRREIRRKA